MSSESTYGSLEAAAEDIKNQADKLDRTSGRSRTWSRRPPPTGTARPSEVYAAKQQDWNKAATSVHNSLKQIAKAVAEAGPTYRAGDRKAAGYFQ